MKVINLMSSSSGNCSIIQNDTTKIMIDAGASLKSIKQHYLNATGEELKDLDALIITHEHGDHIQAAGVVARAFDVPVLIPEKSYLKKQKLFENIPSEKIIFFDGGNTQTIKDFKITSFSTRHDSEASIGVTIKSLLNNKVYSHITDSGSITKTIKEAVSHSDAYFIESDYDEEGLEKCAEYDDILKERIASPFGHLSNAQALDFIKENIDLKSVQWILLGHLSHNTNSPEILTSRIQYKLPEIHWDKLHILTKTLIMEIT